MSSEENYFRSSLEEEEKYEVQKDKKMAVNFRNELIKASKIHFEAHIEKHRINVENLLQNSVGVGEHADIMDTIEKELEEISKYHDLLEVLSKYFPKEYDARDSKELING